MPVTIQQLAQQLELSFSGDPTLEIKGVASFVSAKAGDLCFLLKVNQQQVIADSQCSALIVPIGFNLQVSDKTYIYAENPKLSFVQAMALITPSCAFASGIHPTAQISATADIGENVSVAALSVIGDGVSIGANSQIGVGCVIEDHATIGTHCLLHSRITIAHDVVLGDRCILHTGVVLGSDGFGLIKEDSKWIKVPQIGTVVIGNDVEIGANTTVDRGTLDDTVIAAGCKLDNLIQVAHNVRIGAHTAIAACTGIAGSAMIGAHCEIGGAVGILGHLSIANHVKITAMSLVTKDIRQPGVYSSGTPLMHNKAWHKANVRYKSLDDLARTVIKLEKQSG